MRRIGIEQLVREYQPRLFHLALLILVDGSGLGQADAEGVTQDVFLRAFYPLDSFRGDLSPSNWLYAITVNLCRNALRKRKRRDRIRRNFQALVDLGDNQSHSTVIPGA